jgi:RNA-directed DNA polymerase
MVRGTEDPVFLNLCAKVLELDPNPSKFIRQMVFGADDYEIFISHASEDKADIVRPIYEACQRAALKVFLDETHIGCGDSFTTKINTALGASRTVLAVITSNSVTKEWPLLEVNTALALEASGDKRVIPLVVGTPDLSKLPLIRSKKWLTWDGDAEKVAAELKRLMKGSDISTPVAATPSVPIVPRSEPVAKNPTESPPAPASSPSDSEKSGWLSRLWSRNWSR